LRSPRYHSYKPIFLGLLAEALALTGKIEEGLAVLTEALVLAECSGIAMRQRT
jgi:hypothetical protein